VICKSENDIPLGMWWNRIDTVGAAAPSRCRTPRAGRACPS
jgi:hypothetical protein